MNEQTEQIEGLQNCNGGGLATAATGKHQSCRHALASMDTDKMTVGEFAKFLKKKRKLKFQQRKLK